MIGWQGIAVGLIVCAAAGYIARHLYRAMRSFRLSQRDNSASCASNCGCSGSAEQKSRPRLHGPVRLARAASPRENTSRPE